jgi:ubiquinone/menaquinone biosynthesis C-methylase UbiE
MIIPAHERVTYHEYLDSDGRIGLINDKVYIELLASFEQKMVNILDFGCGNGHVALLAAKTFEKKPNISVYGCDYQEDLLDEFWSRISVLKLKRITPFFMPNISKVHLPAWLPPLHVILFSFSLSCVESISDVLASFRTKLLPDSRVVIIDWQKEVKDPELESHFGRKNRLSHEEVRNALQDTGYRLEKEEVTNSSYFFFLARNVL